MTDVQPFLDPSLVSIYILCLLYVILLYVFNLYECMSVMHQIIYLYFVDIISYEF